MDFQGLQNSFPDFIILFSALLVCVLSWYSYRKYNSISIFNRTLLSFLRGSALIILLILLLNPFFKTTKEVQINPKVAILLDGSESTTIEKGSYKGISDYQKIIAGLRNAPDNVELDFFSFGNNTKIQDPDSFTPNSSSTDLYNAVETITTSGEEYASVLLISDGIVTEGKNPVIEAGESLFPFHVIGIGDTSKVKDVSIKSISTNATGFTNTNHTVNVDVAQYGFGTQDIKVNLLSGDLLIDSKTLSLSSDKEIESLQFDIELNNSGLKQFNIDIEPIADEWITENNSNSFSIEVLDSKKRILHISSGIHPDVKSLRSILERDVNNELSSYTSLGERPPFIDIVQSEKEFDLVIIHGNVSNNILEELEIEITEFPTLFLTLPSQSILTTDSSIKLISTETSELFDIHLSPVNENSDHPILETPDINLLLTAPLKSSINGFNEFPNAITLIEANYQNIPTQSPVLSILEEGNIRRSHLNISGWFKMYINQNSLEREYIIQLINNLVDWTSSNPDNRLLKVKPAKNVFDSGEKPVINASLINESGEVETEGIVEITISGDDFTSNFTMTNLRDGNYQLETANLPEGKYNYRATARKQNRDIDTRDGEFIISESNIELANTIRNDDLLKSIASNSGGIFTGFPFENDIWEIEEISNNLDTKTELRENYLFPIHSVLWFIVVLLLLSTEWMIRKKYALP